MKKMLCYAVAVILALCLVGCSWSVGTTPDKNSRSYDEIFTWGNESRVHSSKTYNIQLGEYGEVQLILDTSLGHGFELDGQTNTITITDKEGQTAVLGHLVSQEQYSQITALYNGLEIRNINNRDYAVIFDSSVNRYISFTYLADCGLNAGLMLEADDDDSFKYLAFTGKALEGSSADIQHYLGTPQDSAVLPAPGGEAWDVTFASGKGFNTTKYKVNLYDINSNNGAATYEVATDNSDVQNILEAVVRSDTSYKEVASALADILRERSGETPLLDIHEEGAYITGINNGMLALVFTADGTDGLTYVMSLYSTDTDNCIDILNSIIDDFLASDITSCSARTEYGEQAGSSSEATPDASQGGASAGPDGFPAFTVPEGFSSTYEGSFLVSYTNGEVNISIYSESDDEFLRFLDGETDNYYGVYQMSEIGSCDLAGYDEVVIAEGATGDIYVYFAGTRSGTLNIQFSSIIGKQFPLTECEALLKQFIE